MLRFDGLVWIPRFQYYSANILGLEDRIQFLFAILPEPSIMPKRLDKQSQTMTVPQTPNPLIARLWTNPSPKLDGGSDQEAIQCTT